jgi:hypothetical protein
MMSDAFTITAGNFPAFNLADSLLRRHLDELARLTKEYPVECNLAGYRFMFSSREDIEQLLAIIDQKLVEYRRRAASRPERPHMELVT